MEQTWKMEKKNGNSVRAVRDLKRWNILVTRTSAVPNLIAVGSAIARQKHEFDSDFALNSDGATRMARLCLSGYPILARCRIQTSSHFRDNVEIYLFIESIRRAKGLEMGLISIDMSTLSFWGKKIHYQMGFESQRNYQQMPSSFFCFLFLQSEN